MKYKLVGLLCCIAVMAAAALAPVMLVNKSERYHQHLEAAAAKEECLHDEGTLCSHLPLVKIDTLGQEIPGKRIWDKTDVNNVSYTTSTEGETTIRADMQVIDREGANNHLTDEPTAEGDIRIRLRGNSSRNFEKGNYAIRLVDDNGINAPQKMMGMDAHHEWILHGPYLDKTLIRNYMWYNISGEIMDYAPNVRFCELMLNGEYRGVYVMTESITAGKDGVRLPLSVNKKNNTFSGYALRLDRGSNNELKELNNFSAYTFRSRSITDIVYPGAANLTEELRRSIELEFSGFEKSLYSYDFDGPEHGYERYIDVQSFVDYFLINELTGNYDAGRYSTYIYKGLDGLYHMCVWDFNSACDNFQETEMDPVGFEMQFRVWYDMLFRDEDFTEKVISRYRQLRKTYFDTGYLNSYIDDTIAYLGDAIDRNYERWGHTFEEEYDMLLPKGRDPRSYEESVDDMKKFLAERIEWMDENIENLRQYSAESKVKKFNENAN